MLLKVGQLEEYLAKRDEGTISAKLSDFEVDAEATSLRIKENALSTKDFTLDEMALGSLAKYFKVPMTYLNRVTPDFRANILNYEFDRNKDAQTVVESLNGDIVSVHGPTQTMIPVNKVASVITKVMDNDDTIRRISTTDRRFHLDVTSNDYNIAFPKENMLEGDITEAGIRVLTYPFQSKKPSVGAYLERLVCMNGMTTEEKFGTIPLKGLTVDEVIASMEEAAQQVLGSLDDRLLSYSSTRELIVPGTPQAFAQQLAREVNVGRQVLDKVLDIINQLPLPVSVWDVNQAFTTVANQVETYTTMVRLQTLGGSLAMDAEKMIERCRTCEQRLV